MKTRIVRIGNSFGIRIPRPVLEQTGLSGEVDIEVDGHRIIINRVKTVRFEWSDAFRKMAEAGDDALLDSYAETATDWDDEEWEW